jgi:Uma2 family endonuclease
MARPASKMRATYQDVIDAPELLIAEILGGELVLTPRPGPPHSSAAMRLIHRLATPFGDAVGGPGGWIFLYKPELHFEANGLEVVVPDLVGWRRERLPEMPKTAAFHVAPDWVCEVLSPSTEHIDRSRKMAIYAREKVGHLWLLDPRRRSLEAYSLADGAWRAEGVWDAAADVGARVAPFGAHALVLTDLWKW